MRHLPEVVEKARELRKKQLSFYEIGRLLNISNNTIRNWCYDLGINRHESLRINNEYRRNKIRKQDIYLVPLNSGISSEQARLFAALLYGCEGAKYPSTTVASFVNSDPKLVSTFISLLRKAFKLDENKIRIQLQIHNSHDYLQVRNFWSRLLNVSVEKFIKPTITLPRGKMRRQNYLGTCSVRYIDNKIQLRLLGIFEKFCSQGEVA
ncbi:MAG TPA: hypothetical protein VIK81_04220 [Patescibacteria group bacterium]